MGRTFDALQRAALEHTPIFQPVPYEPKAEDFPRSFEDVSRHLADQLAPLWCQELWSKTQLTAKPLRSLMFTAPAQSMGCTTTVAYYALYLATKIHMKVLVLDLNALASNGMKKFFHREEKRVLVEMFSARMVRDFKCFDALRRNLVIVTRDGEPVDKAADWLTSPRFPRFLKRISRLFDIILLDTAPIYTSAETRILCPLVDGVILLLESGKSRRRAAQKVKQNLEQSGANLIGSVLSKRKYHIPNWLYRRL